MRYEQLGREMHRTSRPSAVQPANGIRATRQEFKPPAHPTGSLPPVAWVVLRNCHRFPTIDHYAHGASKLIRRVCKGAGRHLERMTSAVRVPGSDVAPPAEPRGFAPQHRAGRRVLADTLQRCSPGCSELHAQTGPCLAWSASADLPLAIRMQWTDLLHRPMLMLQPPLRPMAHDSWPPLSRKAGVVLSMATQHLSAQIAPKRAPTDQHTVPARGKGFTIICKPAQAGTSTRCHAGLFTDMRGGWHITLGPLELYSAAFLPVR